MNQQTLIIGIAVVAIAGVSLYEGGRVERWGGVDQAVLDAMDAGIQQVPKAFGDWESQDVAMDPRQIAAASISSHISRKYRNRVTKAEVDIFLVSGPTKHVVIHSPDLCYAAVGFTEQHRDTKDFAQDSRPAKFFDAIFNRERGINNDKLAILWAWTADGEWKAPPNPRFEYGSAAALYKLYVISTPTTNRTSEPANSAFLREFLPVLDKALFQAIAAPEIDS